MGKTQTLAKAAIFVDAENQTDFSAVALLQNLLHLNIIEGIAFADWRDFRLEPNAQELENLGFQLRHVYSGNRLGEQKDKSDQMLAHAVRSWVQRHPETEVVVLVSGDHYFADLVRELQHEGKRVTIAASPMSVSKELRECADHYIPLGQVASWIKTLNTLERQNRYLTFTFTIRKSDLSPDNLRWLIKCGVVQKKQEINDGIPGKLFLNHQSHAVQMVLGA